MAHRYTPENERMSQGNESSTPTLNFHQFPAFPRQQNCASTRSFHGQIPPQCPGAVPFLFPPEKNIDGKIKAEQTSHIVNPCKSWQSLDPTMGISFFFLTYHKWLYNSCESTFLTTINLVIIFSVVVFFERSEFGSWERRPKTNQNQQTRTYYFLAASWSSFSSGERGWGRCFSLDMMRVCVLKIQQAAWVGTKITCLLENPSNKVKTKTHGLFWMILMKHNV